MNDTPTRFDLVERFFSNTEASYEFIVALTTLGNDRKWKQAIAEAIPADAERIVDLACGTGLSTLHLKRHHPEAHIIGVELRDEYLDLARKKFNQLDLRNFEFIGSAAEDFVTDEHVDAVVSSYLAKYSDIDRLVDNAKAMLQPGGLLLMHDFAVPTKPFQLRMWRILFWCIQNIVGRFYPEWRECFDGLPPLIESSNWENRLEAAMRENGFQDVRRVILTEYGSAMVLGVRESD